MVALFLSYMSLGLVTKQEAHRGEEEKKASKKKQKNKLGLVHSYTVKTMFTAAEALKSR